MTFNAVREHMGKIRDAAFDSSGMHSRNFRG